MITMRNLGRADAVNVSTILYVDDRVLKSERIKVPAKSEISLNISWTPTENRHTLSLVVDPDHMVYELNEDNNRVLKFFSSTPYHPTPTFNRYIWLAVIVIIAIVALGVGITLKMRARRI
jgi:subtilase family serine protease